jgi:hypothetical protein
MATPDAPRRVCAICARVLAAVQLDGRWRYDHEPIDTPADHPAIPVPAHQIEPRGRCDYCTDDDPQWTIPARSFLVNGVPGFSSGSWAACDRCATLIRRDDWTSLRQRALTVMWNAGHLRGLDARRVGAGLDALWSQLRPHILGPPTPQHLPSADND